MRNDTQVYPRAIYNRKVIEAAIEGYRHIATIELIENQTHFICRFSKCVVDEQRVFCEFNNFLIELMNTQVEDMGA